MDQKQIVFPFQARYYQLGEVTERTRDVWFVLHGYGQLARYFLQKFVSLAEKEICVIAPEGLSTFYLENFQAGAGRPNDRVGASWMTKDNRLMDISNYLRYLDEIYTSVTSGKNVRVTILGFSQGSATASRWAMSRKIKFERLILWAGMFPPDMDFEQGKEVFSGKKIFMVYGARDPFLNDERFAAMKLLASKLGVNPEVISFDGEHGIDELTLSRLA